MWLDERPYVPAQQITTVRQRDTSVTAIISDVLFRSLDKVLRWHLNMRTDRVKSALRFCGERVFISNNAIIWGTDAVTIDDDVVINNFTHIFGGGGVSIGARTMISAACSISSSTHPKAIARRKELLGGPVTIGEDCWLGTGAIVLPGVNIGKGSIIGAGAVVSRDIPPMSIAVGVPARVLQHVPAS